MGESRRPMIHWAEPSVCTADYDSLKECFDRKWISQGEKAAAFESMIAECADRKCCVAVNSGSSALVVALIALGISRDSEVVIPAMAFNAVPNMVTMLGGLPVLADIDAKTGAITRETVAPCISKNTLGVIGIDYSGIANDWSDLDAACEKWNVPLVVDAASSFLASTHGRPAGAFGLMTTFSFHSAKTIGIGEGGAVVTDDAGLASLLRQIRSHGDSQGRRYCCEVLGGNFRMTDITAALGISQYGRRQDILARRHMLIRLYLDRPWLRDRALPGYADPRVASNGWTFTILCDERDDVMSALLGRGVETRAMWPLCVMKQPLYRRRPVKTIGPLPNAEAFAARCLSLPVHLGLNVGDVKHISELLATVLRDQGSGVLT